MSNATTTTLLQDAQATTKIAEALTPEQLTEVWYLRNAYSEFGSDISVSGFSEVLATKASITDYLFASLLMDNHYEGFTDGNEDFEGLTQEEQDAFTAECKEALYALNA